MIFSISFVCFALFLIVFYVANDFQLCPSLRIANLGSEQEHILKLEECDTLPAFLQSLTKIIHCNKIIISKLLLHLGTIQDSHQYSQSMNVRRHLWIV